MATFGKISVGVSLYGNGPNRIAGGLYPLAEDGDISKLSLYISTYFGTSPMNVRCAIFDASFNLLGATEAVSILNTPVNAWFDFNFATPIHLVAGNYWLCWLADQNIQTQVDASTSNTMFDTVGDPLSGFPASIPGYKNFYMTNPSIYATYIAVGTLIPPTASFTATPMAQYVGQPVGFDASASLNGDDGYGNPTAIVDYAWNFGDGAIGNGVSVDHSYLSAGTKTVQLTVTDSIGQTHATAQIVTIEAYPQPSVTLPSARSGIVNVAVPITATVNGGTAPYAFAWFVNGVPDTSTTGNILYLTHSIAETIPVTVTVTDYYNQSATAPNPCYVTFSVPSAPTVVLPNSASGNVGDSVTIGATASGGSGNYISYDWYLVVLGEYVSYATTTSPSLTIPTSQSGMLVFAVTVTDSQPLTSGFSNNCTVTITAIVTPILTLLVSPAGVAIPTVNPLPPYALNQQVTIEIAVPSNYQFVHWIREDGSELSPNPATTIVMDANHTYTAVLQLMEQPTLTIVQAVGGNLSASPPPPYNVGDTVQVTAQIAYGYQLVGWLRDGQPYGDASMNPISITLDKNYTITAQFALVDGEAVPWHLIALGIGGTIFLGFMAMRK